VVDARAKTSGVQANGWIVLSTALFSFLIFSWYRLDSDARLYRRTVLLNIGIVMAAIVAVPYYLVRSRPAGQRGAALLRLAGFWLLMIAAGVAGGTVYLAFAPGAA
jgi:hypothetical protein